MNAPLRRTAMVAIAMFLALIAAASWIQVIHAPALNADQRNVRSLYREFNNFRGSIVVGGDAVAYSEPSDDPFGYQRIYADGPLYSAVTGFYSVAVGRYGLEESANSLLTGSADSLWWSRLQRFVTGAAPEGYTVETTILPAAQRAAADALGDQAGAVVAIDPSTGAILALYSSPTYDPTSLAVHSTADASATYQQLLDDPSSPLTNRAIAGDTYPPGSVFKLVTAAAALESGDFSPDSTFDGSDAFQLPGTTTDLHNFGGGACSSEGTITLADALRISCNTAFADLGSQLGASAIASQAADFGFDTDLSIPMSVTPSRFPSDIDDAQTSLQAIGQGSVQVTPLQIAMISATIANDGVRMEPYTVARVRDPDLSVVSTTEPNALNRAVSSPTASALRDMMVSVVESGSGVAAQIPGVAVAGKTGTAEHGDAPDAWFTGFAPADNPRVAVAVVVEHGGNAGSEATGGAVAAPIARAVIEAVLNQ